MLCRWQIWQIRIVSCLCGLLFPCCRKRSNSWRHGDLNIRQWHLSGSSRIKKSPSWFYGLGFWTRGNAEICLLAKKGKPRRSSASVHQFIISPIEQHSKKPDITRDRICGAYGRCPPHSAVRQTENRRLGCLGK